MQQPCGGTTVDVVPFDRCACFCRVTRVVGRSPQNVRYRRTVASDVLESTGSSTRLDGSTVKGVPRTAQAEGRPVFG